MIESGAETYRVEDTMLRMAHSQNIHGCSKLCNTNRNHFFSRENQANENYINYPSVITDLHKIA